jgi:uncharacterized protein with HEPN domain
VSRRERDRLIDIRDAIIAIRAHMQRAEPELSPADEPLVRDAVLYQFVVIGEAVKHLSAETRVKAPHVPWEDVAGLRDLIAHEYFRIEMKRVLEVVRRDLPTLEVAIEGLLTDLGA